MQIKKGSKIYVRLDYKIGEKSLTHQDIQDHMAYVENAAGERYLIGGGFSNIDGGMILFEAENLDEAQKIVRNDPIIENGFYRYELFEWDVAVLSSDF